MPNHNHVAAGTVRANFTPPGGGANSSNPAGNVLAGSGTAIYSSNAANTMMAANSVDVTVGNTGGNQPISVVQPWCAVQFIIATVGIFPSRN